MPALRAGERCSDTGSLVRPHEVPGFGASRQHVPAHRQGMTLRALLRTRQGGLGAPHHKD